MPSPQSLETFLHGLARGLDRGSRGPSSNGTELLGKAELRFAMVGAAAPTTILPLNAPSIIILESMRKF
jgi:hypothetical protein